MAAWNASPAQTPERQKILRQAEARKQSFLALMKSDPATAMVQAIALSDYVALPGDLRPFFEAPLNARGDIDLVWESSVASGGEPHCAHRNTLVLNGERLNAFAADRSILAVARNAPVSGIRLDPCVVLQDSAVREVGPEDLSAARTLFSDARTGTNDPLTGLNASRGIPALIAGELFHFQSAEILAHVDQSLQEARDEARNHRTASLPEPFGWIAGNTGGATGPVNDAVAAMSPYQPDHIDLLVIRVDFADYPNEPSLTDLTNNLNAVGPALGAFSYGSASFTYTLSSSVYRMPQNGATYAINEDNDGIQTDARGLAGGDYTLTDYDVIAVVFPSLSGVANSLITYTGRASIGGDSMWLNGNASPGTILHELGHSYGLYHANYFHPEQVLSGKYYTPGVLEYGDIFDVMGSGAISEAYFNPLALNYLEWLPSSKIQEATGNGTFTIFQFDQGNAPNNPLLAVRVPMAGDEFYWIGYRQQISSTSYNLHSAAYVVGENLGRVRETCLIDMTPESVPTNETNDRKDAGLPVGGSYHDDAVGVHFHALAKGGSFPNAWIQVEVLFDPRISVASPALMWTNSGA
ncbi:MAG: hypothetical protein R3C42_09885 [Parvularculaceae bacterium]